jgi:hypothetical protein
MCRFFKRPALQLHGLLKTMQEKVTHRHPCPCALSCIFSAHQQAYEDVRAIFGKQPIRFIQQENEYSFKHDLMEILFSMTCDMLFFLVDDILFTEPVVLNDLFTFDPMNMCQAFEWGRTSPVAMSCRPRSPGRIFWTALQPDR